MKTNHRYRMLRVLAIIFAIPCMTACNDLLDLPSKTAYESDVVFNSRTRAQAAVCGIYPELKSNAFITYMTPDNDETFSTNTSGERYGLAKYSFSAGSGQMEGPFNSKYNIINRANECIAGLEAEGVLESGSEEDKAFFRALYGEALTLRAVAYFDLIRFWGDVPFKTTPTKAGDDFNLGRTSRDEIYDFILKDLEYAATVVPWNSAVSYKDRITKGAVYGMTARIALHAAGYSLRWDLETGADMGMRKRPDEARIRELYEMARTACRKVMEKEESEHALLDNYEQVFKDVHNKVYNAENVWELGNYGISANGGIGYYIGISIGADTPNGYMASGPQFRMVPSLYYSFDDHDSRRDVTFGNFSIAKTTGYFDIVAAQNFGAGKWRKSWQKTQGPENGKTDINWVMLRYPDILLMFAEADNELTSSPSDEAKNALGKVRKRAFDVSLHQEKVDDYLDALTTKDAFFEAIVQERAWELAAESNIRRTDLIRWNKLASTLQATREALTKMNTDKVNPYTGKKILKYRIYEQKTWGAGSEPTAVPFTEADSNKDLAKGHKAVEFIATKSITTFIDRLAADFEENRTELMPLPQELVDASFLLKNAQHPGYK